jgi:hypothetical protein
MTKLDGDDGLLRSGNRTASRDCVQFVPFADYLAKGPISLAEEVLKEVPTQVLTYFDKHKIRPKKSK